MFSISEFFGEKGRRESLGKMVTSGTIWLMVCIGTLILLLAFLILFHENANATNGYRLRNLERDRAILMLEQEVLNMQVAQAQALESLNTDPQIVGMPVSKNVRYADTAAILRKLSSSSSSSSVSSAKTASGSVKSSTGSSASSI